MKTGDLVYLSKLKTGDKARIQLFSIFLSVLEVNKGKEYTKVKWSDGIIENIDWKDDFEVFYVGKE